MPKGTPPTALQIARYGHIAVALRAAIDARKLEVGEVNVKIGKPRANPGVYHYLRGKGAPSEEVRKKLSKVLNIPEQKLIAYDVDKTTLTLPAVHEPPASVHVRQQRIVVPEERDPLQFNISKDGMARIQLDISLPMGDATPLLRMLLDAGVVFNKATVIEPTS